MKKLGTVICWLLVVAMLPVVAFAQAQQDSRDALAQSQRNQSENLSQFKARLKQEQEKTGFLDKWNDESIDLFASIAKDTDIISIDIHDKNDLRALYQSHCALHHFQTFRWWELDEQYAFYTLVVSLQQRQIEKYGELPAFAKQILEHQHVLPTDQMIGAEAAMEIAWNHLEPSAEQKAYVTLYKDSEDRIVYEVGFDDAQSGWVLIDAFSGEVYAGEL